MKGKLAVPFQLDDLFCGLRPVSIWNTNLKKCFSEDNKQVKSYEDFQPVQ